MKKNKIIEKSKKLKIIEKILAFMSKAVLRKYKPHIVAITGSVGKSSAKESIYNIVSKFIYSRKSEKNYNNEIGIPLTIIGYYPEEYKIVQWLAVFLKWVKLVTLPNKYPKVLILEMGADRPGDIKYLCDLVSAEVGVLTNIGISHLEYFKNQKAIISEKGSLFKSLPPKGLAVYNFDEKKIRDIGEKIESNSVNYGFEEGAQIQATDLLFVYENVQDSRGDRKKRIQGLSFKINFQGKIIPVRLNGTISKASVYNTLAAFGVGQYFNLNLVEMVEVAHDQYFLPGRMNLLRGVKRTMIIDDTYNSAPDSLKLALETAGRLESSRTIAILGDMLELGNMEEKSHKKVDKWAMDNKLNILILVGSRMKLAGKEFARKMGKEKIFYFEEPMEAGKFAQKIIQEGDLILIKGSQGMRMEKVTEELMANPSQKEKLLVRQSQKWRKKKFTKA